MLVRFLLLSEMGAGAGRADGPPVGLPEIGDGLPAAGDGLPVGLPAAGDDTGRPVGLPDIDDPMYLFFLSILKLTVKVNIN